METMIFGCFDFPPSFDIRSYTKLDDHDLDVCVVSVIGKSRFSNHVTKASILNNVIGKPVFQALDGSPDFQTDKIECYYDSPNRIIYMHHTSVYDSSNLINISSNYTDNDEFMSKLENEELSYAKTVLFLFSISHILLLCTPGPFLDLYYLKLFRILESVRNKMLPRISKVLMNFDLPKDWVLSGRPCSPRVLFVFDNESVRAGLSDKGDKSGGAQSWRRHQHTIEDTIYKLLRKNRIVTNISNNSLFAIPPNQEFVFIMTDASIVPEPLNLCLELLHEHCNRPILATSDGTSRPKTDSHTLREFLMDHVDIALDKGFDDNSGKKHVLSVFERCNSTQTLLSSIELYHAFFGNAITNESCDTSLVTHFDTIASLLNTRRQFSNHRCSRFLPMAETAYQEGLPTHYTSKYHHSKLAQAKQVLAQLARGPAYAQYLRQLEESCEGWWRNGRQLCEAVSLTLNHCTNPLHRDEGEPETSDNQHLPVMSHCSQVTVTSVCDCGRTQGTRDDPFTHKMANYDFYMSLSAKCCAQLRHIAMPTFKPSTEESRPAANAQTSVTPTTPTAGAKVDDRDRVKDLTTDMSMMSIGVDLSQSSFQDKLLSEVTTNTQTPPPDDVKYMSVPVDESIPSAINIPVDTHTAAGADLHVDRHPPAGTDLHVDRHSPTSTDVPIDTLSDIDATVIVHRQTPSGEDTTEKDTHIVEDATTDRQASTVEYLPGMIHTSSPPGLLPQFHSWSLCSLGKSSNYNPALGLDQPGFLHGSSFLLPWDITVRADKDKWPALGETSKKGKQRKASVKEPQDVTVRAYIGLEYECPRGHRFFCSAPDKVIKVSSNQTLKDNATKLRMADMPLYNQCLCRSTKTMSQLMRAYIACPDAPITMTLHPQVQPAPSPCPLFHPGFLSPIPLPAGELWVLRFPYMYMGESGAYLPPADSYSFSQCYIMRGLFSFQTSP